MTPEAPPDAREPRTILHVDMDAFYAAVEERDRPELRGKPIIIGADPRGGAGRGVVSTASYAARKFGVGSAMPISTAWRLCPQGIFIQPDMEKYAAVSKEIRVIFEGFTDLVEPISVDEAFLDVTASVRLFGDGPTIARKIKARIREQTKLSAPVGLSPAQPTTPPFSRGTLVVLPFSPLHSPLLRAGNPYRCRRIRAAERC